MQKKRKAIRHGYGTEIERVLGGTKRRGKFGEVDPFFGRELGSVDRRGEDQSHIDPGLWSSDVAREEVGRSIPQRFGDDVREGRVEFRAIELKKNLTL